MKHFLVGMALLSFAFASAALAQAPVETQRELQAPRTSTVEAEIEMIEMRALVGEPFVLDGSGGRDGSGRTFNWRQVSGPFKFSTQEGSLSSVMPQVPGTYVFELAVAEGDQEYIEKRVTVFVAAPDEIPRGADSNDAGEARSAPPLVDGAEPVVVSGIFEEDGVVLRAGDGIDLSVAGVAVRGWDPEKKEAVLARASSVQEINTANDFGLYVASVAIQQEDIEDITVTEDQVEISYPARIRFLGFIPVNVTVKARARADGQTEARFPWYGFLAAKGSQEAYLSLAAEIRAKHEIAKSMIQNIRA